MPFKFLKNKKLLSIIISLIFVLAIVSIFSIPDFERKFRTLTYPFKASTWEKLLASVFQVFKIGPAKRIEVDLSQQKMKTFEDERMVNEFLISTGSGENHTPTGRFRIYNKSIMVYSNIAECWLPFWVGFTSDGLYGFHELPICEEGRKGLEKIGEPASLGCVRLGVKDAEVFYKWVEIGTPVVIYGEVPTSTKKTTATWCYDFKTDLKFGDRSEEVRNLQIALNLDPETKLSDLGSGSPGNETAYFGLLTKKAVIKFQGKYLDPSERIKEGGFVGPVTRNKLNKLYRCH
jgi:hypothetical protein